jgi:U3 small nucleolar RNA-associated protein 10
MCFYLTTFFRLPEDTTLDTLQSLLTSTKVPNAIIHPLAVLLIDAVVSSEETIDTALHRAMLSTIQQRHPTVLQKAAEGVISDDEDLKDAVEQLIISLSMVRDKTYGKECMLTL